MQKLFCAFQQFIIVVAGGFPAQQLLRQGKTSGAFHRAAVLDAHGAQRFHLFGVVFAKGIAHALHNTAGQFFQRQAVLPHFPQPFSLVHLARVAVGHAMAGNFVLGVQGSSSAFCT